MSKQGKQIYDRAKKSRFNKLIRIDNKQLYWLYENKTCRTMAGFLDIIINSYKVTIIKK